MTKFLLIRHALSDTAGKRLTGRSPGIILNERGYEQAELLSERLSGVKIAAICSSPLERAMITAGIIAKPHKLSCMVSEEFSEIDFGSWTNSTIEELKHDPVFIRFNSFRSGTRIPGGELMAEAQLRIVSGIDKLQTGYNDKIVAIVSHADLIRAAIAWYAGMHLDMLHRIMISPASVSIIEIHDDSARILLVNHTGQITI